MTEQGARGITHKLQKHTHAKLHQERKEHASWEGGVTGYHSNRNERGDAWIKAALAKEREEERGGSRTLGYRRPGLREE